MTTSQRPAMNVTRLKLPALRHFVESSAWAIHPEKGAALLELLEARAAGGAVDAPIGISAAEREARAGDRRPITKTGGAIAVLPMYGVIAQRMDLMMAFCGGTSTEAFADEFDAAMSDPNVSAIVIDCDSPGGNVQGTPELAKRIYDARNKGKKIVAVVNGTMASAAYWICSAADEIVCTPSGEVGSIGVFCVHVDQSGYNEMMGLKYTLIRAGEHKAETNPWTPLTPDAEAFIQGQVDETNDMFVTAVAKHRGIAPKKVNADFGQGRCFTATQALAVGMIDRVETLAQALVRLGAKNVSASGRPKQALGTVAVAVDELQNPTTSREMPTGVSATHADMDMPEQPDGDGDDDDLCPDCGAEMPGKQCSACGYMRPDAVDDEEEEETARASSNAGGATHIPSVAGATDADDPPAPDPRPHVGEEPTMDENVKSALDAERKRAAGIRALARDHNIPENEIDAMVDSGVSEDAAAKQILGRMRERHAGASVISVGADREAERPFANAGEQLVAVIQASRGRGVDRRLLRVNHNAMRVNRADAMDMRAGSPDGMNETVGSEGGFFIAPEVLPGVLEPVYKDDPILSRVKRIPIGSESNRTVYRVVDESARTDGNRWGGVQFSWGDEADTPTAKKPKMREVEQVLKKLIGLAYLTDELVQDAPAAQSLIMDAFQTELRWTLANAIFRESGAGRPLGFLNGKGGVQQAIEATQTIANSDQFIAKNVTKMKSNIPAALWGELIWLYNQELLPYLMTATVGTSGNALVFTPAGGFGNASDVDRILGGPAFASELCEAPGTPGDIICIAPSQYHMAEKGGVQVATSLHVKFLSDELAIRFTDRVDGKPIWNTTVTPFKGNNKRGFFSTLATRA